jgi:hypothetical protein
VPLTRGSCQPYNFRQERIGESARRIPRRCHRRLLTLCSRRRQPICRPICCFGERILCCEYLSRVNTGCSVFNISTIVTNRTANRCVRNVPHREMSIRPIDSRVQKRLMRCLGCKLVTASCASTTMWILRFQNRMKASTPAVRGISIKERLSAKSLPRGSIGQFLQGHRFSSHL